MNLANKDIRAAARAAKVPFWKIAEVVYGISEPTMSKRLRREFSETEKATIMKAIKELKEEEDANG